MASPPGAAEEYSAGPMMAARSRKESSSAPSGGLACAWCSTSVIPYNRSALAIRTVAGDFHPLSEVGRPHRFLRRPCDFRAHVEPDNDDQPTPKFGLAGGKSTPYG